MIIRDLTSIYNGLKSLPGTEQEKVGPGPSGFGNALTDALQEVNELQHAANKEIESVVLGTEQNVHQALIAMEKAGIAMQLTIQIRNRVVEAYQEIMRIQV
ncbi:MAG TPA: flagellar hook-basal body complex protein FliE [Atribacteraceae bacterium]|nr:flagellar hook-basal body complex protein FliE [Atribacteraceae bacterium]